MFRSLEIEISLNLEKAPKQDKSFLFFYRIKSASLEVLKSLHKTMFLRNVSGFLTFRCLSLKDEEKTLQRLKFLLLSAGFNFYNFLWLEVVVLDFFCSILKSEKMTMVAALFEVLSYNELHRKLFDEHDWHLLSDCTVSDWYHPFS